MTYRRERTFGQNDNLLKVTLRPENMTFRTQVIIGQNIPQKNLLIFKKISLNIYMCIISITDHFSLSFDHPSVHITSQVAGGRLH